MARIKKGMNGVSGFVGNVVIKQYTDKTVITSKPDMSRVKRTRRQKKNESKFQKAVDYARGILNDPKKTLEYQKKLKDKRSVYHAAIQEYMLGESS
jgi:hypothetical protein